MQEVLPSKSVFKNCTNVVITIGLSQFSVRSLFLSVSIVLFSLSEALFSLMTFEWCSRIMLSSSIFARITLAFWSSIESSGMTKNIRDFLCFSACARAALSDESVFPPPVGTDNR